jgi:hypothetical protein
MNNIPVDEGRLYLAGTWRDASSGDHADVLDPSTGRVIATVADAGPADVDVAVSAAREAFDSGPWEVGAQQCVGGLLHRLGGQAAHVGDLLGQVLQSLVERGAHGFHGRQVRAGSAQVAITVTGFGDVRCSVFGLVSAVVEATSHPCG